MATRLAATTAAIVWVGSLSIVLAGLLILIVHYRALSLTPLAVLVFALEAGGAYVICFRPPSWLELGAGPGTTAVADAPNPRPRSRFTALEPDTECPVCLDVMDDGRMTPGEKERQRGVLLVAGQREQDDARVAFPPCGHPLHYGCARRVMLSSGSFRCPICREETCGGEVPGK
jgi:hypothetical protein